ncbi:glycosyl transferase [Lacimicrobium alkaliphilum]|uniref:Glycosyl transferase n=2 Tax=Lacimicrobium alkaliphilum TaxID=1526571 RepID=A0ABQ1RJN6_9ALTE|nr:glycosyl transferase [Lacimicrobium alkaliphilum]
MITLYLTFDITKRLWDRTTGMLAAGALLLTLQFVIQAKSAQIDAMVSCWIAIGCYGLLRHLLLQDGWSWYWLGFAAMGLGVITKGVGFLPVLMLIPFFIARRVFPRQSTATGSAWHWWSGPVVMLITIGLWLIPMLIIVSHSDDTTLQAYRDNIMLKQTATRYADAWHHIKPFWYYLTSVIPVLWLPLSLLLPWLVPEWVKACKKGELRIILPLFWILLLLLFFSMSPGKRGVYILPALPMLALISAPYLRQMLNKPAASWALWLTTGLISTVLLIVAIGGWYGLDAIVQLVKEYELDPWSFLLTCSVVGFISLALSWRYKALSWAYYIPLLWLLYSTWGYLLMAPAKTPQKILEQSAKHLPASGELAMIGLKEQFLLFSDMPFTHFGYHTPIEQQQAMAWRWLKQHPDSRILAASDEKLNCFRSEQGTKLGHAHRQDWLLLGPKSAALSCPQTDSLTPVYRTEKTSVYDHN